jgi:hypothetical protein
MSAIQMRGYVPMSAATYLRNTAGEQTAARLLASMPAQARRSLETATQAGWCPAPDVAELFRVIASLGDGDEDRARNHLVECGKNAAREASNTFLRLLMKLLTPAMFAKKLPELWGRDCTGGKITVAVHEDRIVNHLLDMQSFDHIAPVAIGYVMFALEAMGKNITEHSLHGWSLAQPSAPDSWFEIRWRT